MRTTLAGIKTYFDANMETILLAMEAEYSVTIERLVSIEHVENAARQYPYMVILPNDGNNEYGDENTPVEQGFKIRNAQIIVVHNSTDIVEVQDTLLYYEDAVNRLIENDNTFGSLFNRVRLGDEDFSEMGQWIETKEYEQSVLMILEVRKLLSY